MRHWFWNLNERGRYMFHFRGTLHGERKSLLRYEAWSGPALKLEYTHGNSDENEANLSLGLIFFSLSLSWRIPESWCFKRKYIATWDNDREFTLIDGRCYGFYTYEWALSWKWNQRINESLSGGPWWKQFYFRIDDFFLGRTEYMTHDLMDAENVAFKLGGKEFIMDSVRWYDATWFRRRIPLSLYGKKMVRAEMKINKPPMRSGKGENSWDCGDDGTFGLTTTWEHERPTWLNKKQMTKLAVQDYVTEVLKDAKRYGSSDGERGISVGDVFEFVGMTPNPAPEPSQEEA
jgi:hypothetical protein